MEEAWKCKRLLLTLFLSTLILVAAVVVVLTEFNSSAFLSVAKSSITGWLETSVSQATKTDKCDIFTGKWIPDPSGPAYTNDTCRTIPDYVNCMTNGRPDRGYLHWRWKPDGCDLPPFDAHLFLKAMRNKNFAIVGDSLAENHFDTLLCLLSKVEEPALYYCDEQYFYRRWGFYHYNFTLTIIWSPMLALAENTRGKSSDKVRLHLGTLDPIWTDEYHRFDYVIFSTGEWFLLEVILLDNGTIVGCTFCPGMNVPELGKVNTFRRVLQSVFRFITDSDHKPVVLYRAFSPAHYGCSNRTMPYHEGEYDGTYYERLMRRVEVEELLWGAAEGAGEKLKLMDTYNPAVLRPDGHPGPYRTFEMYSGQVGVTDCTHWCVPGAIDSWNDILMHMLLDGEESSSNI